MIAPKDSNPSEEGQKQRKQEHEAMLREYAKTLPHLERAAKEGYEIASAVIDHIANLVTKIAPPAKPRSPFGTTPIPGFIILTADTDEWEDAEWEERKAPFSKAFEAFDNMLLHLTTIDTPACVMMTLHRIARFRLNESAQWMTAIVVEVGTEFWNHRLVVIPAE